MKAFSTTVPATTNYYNLWTLLTAIPGWAPAGTLVPDRCCELILGSDSGVLLVSDSNYANVAGMPIAVGGCLALRTPGNSICLKEIFVKGSGMAISGWYVWI